jgi:hypothetical protein
LAADAHGAEVRDLAPADFLALLDRAATYALTRGVPSFLGEHLLFLVDYVNAWIDSAPGREVEIAQALLGGSRRSTRLLGSSLMVGLLQADRIPRRVRAFLLLAPRIIRLLTIALKQFLRSAASSAIHAFRAGIRSVPPLITAVVVVFVTSDAWRFLGTGFTLRFFALVGVFLLASMVFLVRRDYWADIDMTPEDATTLLEGINPRHLENLDEFLARGAEPTPVDRPAGIGAALTYLSYLALSLFSLLVVAIFVAVALIVVGVILFDARETKLMAHSAQVFWALPGNIVVTRQLLSLSLSLGAFAAFFEVAAMRVADRKEYMDQVLVRLRRALLVYTVYCRARAHAQEWTGIPVEFRPGGRPRSGADQALVPDGTVSPAT